MTTAIATPAQAHPARQKALEQFLEKLRSWSQAAGGGENLDRQAKITIGSRSVTLEPWERVQLADWFSSGESAEPAARYLLAHGAALMLKTAFDIERLTRLGDDSSTKMYAMQAELMLDTAIGMALLRDIQAGTDELVKCGQFENAKGLTQFRHRLARVVGDAKMCIAESEQEQAEMIAGTLSDHPDAVPASAPTRLTAPVTRRGPTERDAPAASPPPNPASPPPRAPSPSQAHAQTVVTSDVSAPTPMPDLSAAIAPDGSAVTAPRRRPRRRRPKDATRASASAAAESSGLSSTQLLGIACMLAFVAWLLVTQLPIYLEETRPHLGPGDFTATIPIVSVESHAPSVYVTIEAAAWDALDAADRDRTVREFGQSADRAGFTGVLLRGEDGQPLAHWLSLRGAEQIVGDESLPQAEPRSEQPVVEFKVVGGSP